jgi:hypothetical protein
VFPRGRWAEYAGGLKVGDKFLPRKTRKSYKLLKRLG